MLRKDHFAYSLIGDMIKKVEDRTNLTQVMEKLLRKNSKLLIRNLLICYQTIYGLFKTYRYLQNSSINLCFIISVRFSQTRVSRYYNGRFHPTDAIFGYGSYDGQVTILKAANGSVSFFDWRFEGEYKCQNIKFISSLEWNVSYLNLTQLTFQFGYLARFGPPINDVTLLLINAGTES